jgi:hypothetical protein
LLLETLELREGEMFLAGRTQRATRAMLHSIRPPARSAVLAQWLTQQNNHRPRPEGSAVNSTSP